MPGLVAVPGDKPEETIFLNKGSLDLPLLKSRLDAFEAKLASMHALLKSKGRAQTAETKRLRLPPSFCSQKGGNPEGSRERG